MSQPVIAPYPRFRDRITVYSITEIADTYGGQTTAEVSLGSAWAAVEKLSGTELWRGGGVVTESTHKITTWYRSDITPKCIAKLGTRTFDIMDIDDVENRHQYLEILVKERKG